MYRIILPIIMACSIAPFLSGQSEHATPPKSPHSLRLLCVEAVPAASRLIVLEKSGDGWVARWRITVSGGFITDPLGFASRSLGLAVDPAPPASSGAFNGPALRIDTPMEVTPFGEFQ